MRGRWIAPHAAVLALTIAAAALRPAAADVPPGLTAESSLDRPAMWVADRVTYTVEISCPRGFDILVDDLGRDKLKLTGFEVINSETSRTDVADGTRYVFRYVLTSFKVEVASPAVAPFPVRYYAARAGQRPDEATPAGSIVVPGASVAFRSLLPDDQPAQVRDERGVPDRWTPYRVLGPVGIGLILLSLAPVAFLIAGLAHRARARRQAHPRPSARQVRHAARAAFDEIRSIDASAAEARRDAFARLAAAVRGHVADTCDIAVAGLTPDELARAIEPCAGRVSVELVTSILAACELARYAAPASQPSADDWRAALTQAEQLLSTSG